MTTITTVVHHIAIDLCSWRVRDRRGIDIFSAPRDVRAALVAGRSGTGTTFETAPIELCGYDMSATKGCFRPLPVESVDLGEGIVHLYKDEVPSNASVVAPHASAEAKAAAQRVLAILAVPSYMTSSDLIGFLGAHVLHMSHIRLVRTPKLNRYMVLTKFRSAKEAAAFKEAYNGKAFNSIDAETAHVVSIGTVTFGGHAVTADDFPDLAFVSEHAAGGGSNSSHGTAPEHPTSSAMTKVASSSNKPLPPATGNLTELPTCVICLERMDDTVTGLLTILCDHTFHCSCINKWVSTQSTCPVCRFSVARAAFDDLEQKACCVCLADKNLWMCLICGNVACGRYESQHAIAHYDACAHAFAMDLESGRIWDYASDSYVHRLVQDKLDAKPSASKQSFWSHKPSRSHAARTRDGIDGADDGDDDEYTGGTEFEELLATQLESQRIYYEDQVKAAVDKAAKHSRDASLTAAQLQAARAAAAEKAEVVRQLEQEQSTLRAAESRSAAKNNALSQLARKLEGAWKEEQAMNASLMQRIAHLERGHADQAVSAEKLAGENQELKEQINDLLMHFAAASRIDNLDEAQKQELQQGSIGVSGGSGGASKKKAARKARK